MEDASVAQGSGVWDSLFDGVLGDRAKVTEESQLPQTGMPASVEQELSSIFVEPFQLKVPQPHVPTREIRSISAHASYIAALGNALRGG